MKGVALQEAPEGARSRLAPEAPATSARPRPEPTPPRVVPRREPWQRSAREWDRLEPRSLYARRLRTPLLWSVTLVLSFPALLLALPIVLVNAVVHRSLSRVLFRQERVGRRGCTYVIYKFRTMRDDASLRDEERVTPFGRFLRNTHLDELPQFLNILRGDMCLIGPRPEMLSIERWATRAVPGFGDRMVLRPGVTGLAQITQGYAADGDRAGYARKAALDARYRSTLSLRGDLAILVRTSVWMLRRRGWRPECRRQEPLATARS